jgi:capsular exopolysaccharide synthesis family protein
MLVNEHIQVLRRRWIIVLAGLVVGAAAGYLTAPGEDADRPDYKATTTLIANPALVTSNGNGRLNNLDTAALLVTTGQVPVRVADRLGLRSADAATRKLVAQADADVGSITITATDRSPELASRRAKVFGEELITAMTGSDRAAYQESLDRANDRVVDLEGDLFAYNNVLRTDTTPDPDLQDERDAIRRELDVAQSTLDQLIAQREPKPVLIPIENGPGREVDPPGIEPPDGRVQRGALLGVLGLLLGGAAAFGLDRMDTKIRSASTAHHAFGHPVVAEVPPLPGRRARTELLAITRPASPVMEAYRGLRTVIALTQPVVPQANGNGHVATNGNGHGPASTNGTGTNGSGHRGGHGPGPGGGRVIVVASGAAGEGKTTTSAHLAAALAEVGHSVLVVSADFRRPRLHTLFEVPREPGLTEVLAEDDVALGDMLLDTPIPGVRILTSGAPARNPAPLMMRTVDLLLAARKVFDYVIVDTAPLLIANDASELIQAADGVVLMARNARTSIEAAQRASELVARIKAPVVGVVLVGATDAGGGYYYRYRYYGDRRDRRSSSSRRRGEGRKAPAAQSS